MENDMVSKLRIYEAEGETFLGNRMGIVGGGN